MCIKKRRELMSLIIAHDVFDCVFVWIVEVKCLLFPSQQVPIKNL